MLKEPLARQEKVMQAPALLLHKGELSVRGLSLTAGVLDRGTLTVHSMDSAGE